MMGRKERVSLWPLLLAMGMLVAALGTLFWLRARLAEGQDAVLDGTVRRFEATGVLGRAESRSIVFEEVETLAMASQNDLVMRLYVTKRLRDGTEVAVVPFYLDLVDPQWREEARWLKLPVGEGPSGYLYMDINNATLRAVNAAMGLLAALLVAGFAVLILRQRGKEAQVGQLQSELQARKAQVIQLERLALAGQLSANILHDIKKPVLNIKHEVSDALDGAEEDSQRVLRDVQAQTELFLQILRDLGMESFVKASAQENEWCDLHELAERSLRLVQYEQGNVEAEIDFDPEKDYLIQAMPHRMVQLFSNLVLNAFQALGGTGRLRIRGMQEEGKVNVTVEDDGPGILAGEQEEIFSPFVTSRTETGGSGLGLYISKTIVEDLGGGITVGRSKDLGGACFTITLPNAEQQSR